MYFVSFLKDDLDRSFLMSPNTSKTSLYDSLRHSSAATVLENLQSQLKQREGEIVQLRVSQPLFQYEFIRHFTTLECCDRPRKLTVSTQTERRRDCTTQGE